MKFSYLPYKKQKYIDIMNSIKKVKTCDIMYSKYFLQKCHLYLHINMYSG